QGGGEAGGVGGGGGVVDRGLVVADGTPAELKAKTGGQTLVVRAADPAQVAHVARAVAELTGARPEVRPDAGLVTAPAGDPAVLPAVVRWLDQAGVVAEELALRLPSLDEVFLTLTGRRAEETAAGDGPRGEGRAA